jgi:hypothetical protein
MRSIIVVLSFVGAALALAQTADSTKATVYVYRNSGGSGPPPNSPSAYCDEHELARMQHGRYFGVPLDAGKHSFRSTDGTSVVDIDVKAGQTYYIRGDVVPVGGKPRGHIALVSPEEGVREAHKLKPLGTGMVKDPNRVVIAPL